MKVEYVDHMGSDLSVVNAARVSFAKRKTTMGDGDERLIRYLAKHRHSSPFYHTAITLRMAAPVPIRTQCYRHTIHLVPNEESRRYVSDTPEVYVPSGFRSRPDGNIKQGSGDKHPNSDGFVSTYKEYTSRAVRLYTDMIEAGICPEQARFVLPQGAIVNWIWTGNLFSYANFVLARSASDSQLEVQRLAAEVSDIISPLFPISWASLMEEGR